MGRLWQTLILSRWNASFAHVPVESLVHAQQAEYYQAIQDSTSQSDCAPFIQFMLERVGKALIANTAQVTPQVRRLIAVLQQGEMTREALKTVLGLQDRKSFRERYLKPALDEPSFPAALST